MSSIFHVILYQPILNVLVTLYNYMPGHDFGLVIIVLTIILRVVLYPLMGSSIKAQQAMQELQPKLEEIKKKYAGNQQMQAQATMELYKESKINPMASCLPLLIQLPILFALFFVLRDAISSNTLGADLYGFVHDPGKLDTTTLNWFDLAKPSAVMAVLAGLAQFIQTKSLVRKQPPAGAGEGAKDESMTAMMNKQMMYMMPAMTAIIGLRFPAGLTLYWFFSTLLMAGQQLIMRRRSKKPAAGKVIEGEIVK